MTSAVFLSPHNDDETLFGAFTLMTVRPHVVICLRSVREFLGFGITHEEREAETESALQLLGVPSSEQWAFSDASPTWDEIHFRIEDLASKFDVCYAPTPSPNGEPPRPGWGIDQHDYIGFIASCAFEPDRIFYYKTYSSNDELRTWTQTPYTGEFLLRKWSALACYVSQIKLGTTAPHFVNDQREYLSSGG